MDTEIPHDEDEFVYSEHRVDLYNPNKAVRLSNDLFDITKSVSTLSSTHGVKLVYAIAQAVQDKNFEVFGGVPRINMAVQAAFDYLAIGNSNRRYELLKGAFESVMNNSLHLVDRDARGNMTFRGVSWISGYEYSTNKDRIYIILNPLAIHFLRELSRYASIQPKYYNKLSSAYQLWLLPFLRNKEKMGSFRVRIDELKTLLNSDSKESYTDEMRGTNTFLKRVLGITISQAAKEENARAKKEKETPAFIPWDYVRDKDGKPYGTLYNINLHTDIKVCVRGIKNGRAYEEVEFFFVDPAFFIQKGTDAKAEVRPPDLFSNQENSSDNDIKREGWGWVPLTEEQERSMMKEFKKTKDELASMSRFMQLRNGRLERYMELPYFGNKEKTESEAK